MSKKISLTKTPKAGAGTNSPASKTTTPKASTATVANTPVIYYRDSAAVRSACRKKPATPKKNGKPGKAGTVGQGDFDKIDEKCKPETQDQKDKRKDAEGKKKGSLLSRIKSPSHSGKNPNPDAQWINDHCEFLMHKPGDAEGLWKELEGSIGEAAVNKVMEATKQKLETAVENAIAKKVATIAAKSAAKRLLSLLTGPGALVINAALIASDLYELSQAMPDIEKQFADLKSQLDDTVKKVKEAKEIRERYLNSNHKFSKDALVADMMHGASVANPCTNARRCMLVKFNDTDTKAQAEKGKGCCPGQTGHHLLPSAMYAECKAYNEKDAPTICAEGANNSNGSHGMIHRNVRDKLKELTGPGGKLVPYNTPITKDQAIESAIKSVQKTFPTAGCDPKCIRAQLDEYYKTLDPCKPNSHPGVNEGDAGSTSTTPTPIG